MTQSLCQEIFPLDQDAIGDRSKRTARCCTTDVRLGNINAAGKAVSLLETHVNGNVDLRIEKARDPESLLDEKNPNLPIGETGDIRILGQPNITMPC